MYALRGLFSRWLKNSIFMENLDINSQYLSILLLSDIKTGMFIGKNPEIDDTKRFDF